MSQQGWQDEVIARLPSGIDRAQLDELARLTPTERLERMRRFLEELERIRTGHADAVPDRH